MLNRRSKWEQRLESYIAANRLRPFLYGDWDCCLFVCGAIEAMTGIDPSTAFRGHYASPGEARALIKQFSGARTFERFIEFMAGRYTMPEVAVPTARRGDVVLVPGPVRQLLGLVALDGRNILLVGATPQGADGIGLIPLDKAMRAWRV